MTEYDFSPEGFERYRSTQDRIAQWVGSSQQYSSVDPFMTSSSEDGRGYPVDRSEYWGPGGYGNNTHSGRRRRYSRSLRNDSATGVPMPLFDTQRFGLDSEYPGMTGSLPGNFPPPLSSRNGSVNPAISELTHHQEYFPPPPLQGSMYDIQNITANREDPYHPSHFSSFEPSIQRDPSLPNHIPVSATGPRFLPESDEWNSSRSYSYSSDSYSTGSYQSFESRSYRTIHPSSYSPTIIQPSTHYPIVVPIDRGVGGYVVVPAVGQNLQVVVSADLLPSFSSNSDHSLGFDWEIQSQI